MDQRGLSGVSLSPHAIWVQSYTVGRVRGQLFRLHADGVSNWPSATIHDRVTFTVLTLYSTVSPPSMAFLGLLAMLAHCFYICL